MCDGPATLAGRFRTDTVSRLMPTANVAKPPSPPLVAVAGWLVPGGGYWALGERTRALTVGITIVALFIMGLLIGGIRVLEIPGFGPQGHPLIVSEHVVSGRSSSGERGEEYIERVAESVDPGDTPRGWLMLDRPLVEIRNKPWAIAQIMTGPLGVVAGAGAVFASRPVDAGDRPAAARSHARLNEIGVLYTAVAGMLNLMVIIDAAYRAGHTEAK